MWSNIHDLVAEKAKLSALQWLVEEVSEHVLSGTILNADFTSIDAVLHKEVPDINVPCALATRRPPVK